MSLGLQTLCALGLSGIELTPAAPTIPASDLILPWQNSPLPLPQNFDWKPDVGEKILAQFGKPGTQIIDVDDLKQGLVSALFHAEELAVAAGLSSTIPTDKGPGYIIGAGEAKARALVAAGQAQDPRIQRYLNVLDSVRAVTENAKAAPVGSQVTISLPTFQTVALPALAIVAIVVGLAAIVAGAWTYVESKKLEVIDGPLARVKAAVEGLKAGLPPSMIPGITNPPPPPEEGFFNWKTVSILALIAVGVGGVWWAKNNPTHVHYLLGGRGT